MKSNLLLRYSVILASGLLAASSGQADILESASNFAAFGGTAITNVGTSSFSNGKVGTTAAIANGFVLPTTISGAAVTAGAEATLALADLNRARTGLGAMAAVPFAGTELGGGLPLKSGVYKITGNATLSLPLTLDGEGKKNAYWVFQITGGFSQAATGVVNVTGTGPDGGKNWGLFWDSTSSISVAAGAITSGVYISNANIQVNTGATGSSRTFAVGGANFEETNLNVLGGPGGGDWSGSLMYDPNDPNKIVPIPEDQDDAQASADPLQLSIAGKRKRVTKAAKRVVRGTASTSANSVQFRVNKKKKWRTATLLSNNTWTAKIRKVKKGNSRIRFRALGDFGAVTEVKVLRLRRVSVANKQA